MKNILIITPYCPYPPHKSGGTHALYNLIKENDFRDNIDLLYYDHEDKDAEREIKKYVKNVYYNGLKKDYSFTNRIVSIIKRIPYGIYQYNVDIKIQGVYDKIIFDQPLSMGLVDKLNADEKIIFSYDSMIMYFDRLFINSRNLINKLYNKIQSIIYRRYCNKVYDNVQKIFYVSEVDKTYEENIFLSKDSTIFKNIYLGVDSKKFNIDKYDKSDNKSIIFTGIMDYEPNKDAVLYFYRSIYNKLKVNHPNLKFYIVGKNPGEEILKLNSKDVIVTGFVDDIVEYISKATIYISPLRLGTGMKNKVLEAMSCKKPIVASKISVEGITELKNSKNIYIANDDDEWIRYVDYLLKNQEKRNEFGIKCRNIIESKYNWKVGFEKIFR